MSKQLIITGFHRSGTSVLAQEFHNAGLHIGDRLMKADSSNVDGHFEDVDFFTLHNKILHDNGVNWKYTSSKPINIYQKHNAYINHIVTQRSSKYAEWGFKDPRASIFLDLWQEQLNSAYSVIIYRHYDECIHSLLNRASKDIVCSGGKSHDIEFWQDPMMAHKMWLNYNKKIIEHIKKYPNKSILISHQSLMNGFPIVKTIKDKFNFNLDLTSETSINKELLSSKPINMFTIDNNLKKELDKTWNELQTLSLEPSKSTNSTAKSDKTYTVNMLKNTLNFLGITKKETNPIDSTMKSLKSNDIEIEEKINIIKENYPIFKKFSNFKILIEYTEILIKNNLENIELHRLLASLYLKDKNYTFAENTIFKLFTRADKIEPYFYYELASIYLTKGDIVNSTYYINRAIKENPDNPSFYQMKAMIEFDNAKFDKSFKYLNKAMDTVDKNNFPTDMKLNFYISRLNFLYILDDYKASKSLFDILSKEFPNNARVEKERNHFKQSSQIKTNKKSEINKCHKSIELEEYFQDRLEFILKNISNDEAKNSLIYYIEMHLRTLPTFNNLKKKTCIIVLGMHRSGTSCLMGSLEKYELFVDDISTWNPYNTKGNREHPTVVELNNKVLKYNNASWDNPPSQIGWNDELREERDEFIDMFLKTKEEFFGFKDPRTLFTIPFWEEGLKEKATIKYVGSYRDPNAVIASLTRRDSSMSEEDALNLWQKYNVKLLDYYNEKSFPMIEYDMSEERYMANVSHIAKRLGLKSTNNTKDNFYDVHLNNNQNETYDIADNKIIKLITRKLKNTLTKTMLSQRSKKLTIVINFHNMQREAKRTLFTLTSSYQEVSADLYDVIVIDNSSTQTLSSDFIQSFGSNFFYIYYNSKHPSPVEAINYTIDNIKSEFVMCIIDGARMLSPGILKNSLEAWKLSEHPFVYTLGMHIGDDIQNITMQNGYNQESEDKLLKTIEWQTDGYKLFDISSLAASSKDGYFSKINESNCFSLKKDDFFKVGGFNKEFKSSGGGLVNLDFFNKINQLESIEPTLLLGEATFHQFHGGVATNIPLEEHPFKKMNEEYKSIYGENYVEYWRVPNYFTNLNEEVDKREKMDPHNRNGHTPLPDGIVISSERSGLNFVRHIVESMTPYRTAGKVHIHEKGKLIFHRTHHVHSKTTSPGRTHVIENETDRYKKLLYLIRDPRETFVRAYNKSWDRLTDYCDNLKYFDEFKGEKKIVYYDDLVSDDKVLGEIFDFFNIEEYFKLEDMPQLRIDAVEWYDKHQQKGGGSMTKGKADTLTMHQQQLSSQEIEELSNFLKEHLKDQLEYFNRWNENRWI